ncbi:MAG TPA: 3'-5' exonuclease [Salinivirgaceae bacterium]|nr:3'-5' exonuclease [Salinivirgaceae bacterium]
MIDFDKEITRDIIDQLPLKSFEGEIVVVSDLFFLDKVVSEISKSKVLGFDTETRPVFKKGEKRNISLLQLYDGNRAYLFRINKIGFAEQLREILQNENIIKAGAAVHDDLKGLRKLRPFNPKGFVDLQTIAKQLQINDLSVRKLAARILEIKISKRQQLSNWDNDILEASQIRYAATDAWICYLLYFELKKMQEELVKNSNITTNKNRFNTTTNEQ